VVVVAVYFWTRRGELNSAMKQAAFTDA
jgi:hypothetical protein